MKKKYFIILFFFFLNLTFLNGQKVGELKFIKEEKINNNWLLTKANYPFQNLFDYKGNFVTPFNFSYNKERKPMVDFFIDGINLKFHRFLLAQINKNVNRLYTFGKSPLPSSCGVSPCKVRGFKIYDLKGNLIKKDSSSFKTFGYAISENGNFYVAGNSIHSDTFLVKKFDVDGNLIWKKDLPIPFKRNYIKVSISQNEKIVIWESSFSSFSNSVYMIEGQTGNIIWNNEFSYRSFLILFSDDDFVYSNGLNISHYSIKQDSLKLINKFLSGRNQYTASDKTGKLFGGVIRLNWDNPNDKEKLFILFKRINNEYVPYKKLDLSKYNFTWNSSTQFIPSLHKITISSKGEIILFTPDKKLYFK